MSKILKAMQKANSDKGSISERLQQIDHSQLFPLPHPDQVPEFEQLVNSLIRLHTGKGGMVIVFSSATHGEGNSFVSYNVARQLYALMGRKVAWVDANFNHPQSELTDLEHNFRQLLVEPDSWDDFPVADSLTLVPNGSLKIKATDLLRSEKYERVLAAFRNEFFFTVLDAPPVLESVDVAHLASPADGLVMVIESRRLKHEVIKNGVDNLRSHGVEVLGAVLNKRIFEIPNSIYKRL